MAVDVSWCQLMSVDVSWCLLESTPVRNWFSGSIYVREPIERGWDGLQWKRIEHVKCLTVVKIALMWWDSWENLRRSYGLYHHKFRTHGCDTGCPNLKLSKNCTFFWEYFIALGFSIRGTTPKSQICWVTWSQSTGLGGFTQHCSVWKCSCSAKQEADSLLADGPTVSHTSRRCEMWCQP